jgi:integrase
MLNKDILPILGHMAVEDVKKAHIAAVVLNVKERGTPRMAQLVFSTMRQMFRFAVEADLIETDPSASISKVRLVGRGAERDRVLTEAEVRQLFKALPTADLVKSTQLALLICLGTACRIGEALNASWADIDLKARTWRIPAANAKNSREHIIWLSDFVIQQFQELRALHPDSSWCFPARTGVGPVCNKSVAKQVGDRQRGEQAPMSRRSPNTVGLLLPGGKWTPHDLRRTAATVMVSLGVAPAVVERCLNHVEQNRMARIYQRHSYRPEMEQAWRLLGERLELLACGDENILTLSWRAA